jgi:ubiquinone/menaquinone biosynthesis C-methylase UbiE
MENKVCPFWIGYLLLNPFRKLLQNPYKILQPYIKEGLHILDVGSAMGFFSLPIAKMVGKDGKVICVDLQPKMLDVLKKRAKRANLQKRIITVICQQKSLQLQEYKNSIDFILASAVLHEIPDVNNFFTELMDVLKQSGKLLLIEPRGHVTKEAFAKSTKIAQNNGFEIVNKPKVGRSHTVLLTTKLDR